MIPSRRKIRSNSLGNLKMEWASRCDSEPPITNRAQAELNIALVGTGVGHMDGGYERKPVNRKVGPPGPQRERSGRQGVALACAGHGTPAGGPGGEACSGSIPGAARRGGRGRRASILSGGGDAQRELPGADWRARRSRCCQPHRSRRALCRAPRDRPAPWTEAAVRGAAAAALVAARGGQGRTRRTRGYRGGGREGQGLGVGGVEGRLLCVQVSPAAGASRYLLVPLVLGLGGPCV